jgi:hypothetical protein
MNDAVAQEIQEEKEPIHLTPVVIGLIIGLVVGDRDGSRDANHGSATLYEETKPELIIKWSRSKDTLKKP